MTNLFAYTAPGSNYPEFVSVNLDENQNAVLIVRSPAKADGSCGDTAQITLSPKELYALAHRLFSFACTNAA